MNVVEDLNRRLKRSEGVLKMNQIRKHIWIRRFLRLWHEGKEPFNAPQVEAMGKPYKEKSCEENKHAWEPYYDDIEFEYCSISGCGIERERPIEKEEL